MSLVMFKFGRSAKFDTKIIFYKATKVFKNSCITSLGPWEVDQETKHTNMLLEETKTHLNSVLKS